MNVLFSLFADAEPLAPNNGRLPKIKIDIAAD